MIPRIDLYPDTTVELQVDSIFAEEDLPRYCGTFVINPSESRANYPYYERWCNGSRKIEGRVRQEKTPWVLITRNKWISPHGDLYDCQWGTAMSFSACNWRSTQSKEDILNLMYSGFCPVAHADAFTTRFNYTTSITAVRRYNKIFILAQPWGDAVGHFLSELAPTIWTFIDILRADPSIAVYTTRATPLIISFLNFIGIESNRILSHPHPYEHDMFAPVAIWPMRSIYMRSHGILLRAATQDLKDILQRRHPSLIDEDPLVLVLTRNGIRQTPNWADLVDAIFSYIADLASRPNATSLHKRLRLKIFSDSALPSFEEGAKLFFRAHLIVATHGAGIGNILFAKANTTLIEIHNSRPVTPHAFLDMAENLGMRYIGLRPDKINVNVSRIIQLIDGNLRFPHPPS
jgi:hypothetical protein